MNDQYLRMWRKLLAGLRCETALYLKEGRDYLLHLAFLSVFFFTLYPVCSLFLLLVAFYGACYVTKAPYAPQPERLVLIFSLLS